MPLTDAGITHVAQVTIGESVTAFDNTNGYIGVGDDNTAFSVSQTDLQAASNKVRAVMDSTFPSRSGLVVTIQATFSTSLANFAWEEWGWFNAASSGTMMSRKVESLGTKTSAQTWEMNADMTWDNP